MTVWTSTEKRTHHQYSEGLARPENSEYLLKQVLIVAENVIEKRLAFQAVSTWQDIWQTSLVRITEIAVYQYTLPLSHPYSLSGCRLHFKELDSTFIRLTTDIGMEGWGEGCPWGSTYTR